MFILIMLHVSQDITYVKEKVKTMLGQAICLFVSISQCLHNQSRDKTAPVQTFLAINLKQNLHSVDVKILLQILQTFQDSISSTSGIYVSVLI